MNAFSKPNPLVATDEDKAQAKKAAATFMGSSALLPEFLQPIKADVLQNGGVDVKFLTEDAANTFQNALLSICESRECIRRGVTCSPSTMFGSTPSRPTHVVVHKPATLVKLVEGLEELHNDAAAKSDNTVLAQTFLNSVEAREANRGR